MRLENLKLEEIEKLILLQEECSELIQSCSKILRFGKDAFNPEDDIQEDNLTKLTKEIADVQVLIKLIINGFKLDTELLDDCRHSKIRKLKKYTKYQFELEDDYY